VYQVWIDQDLCTGDGLCTDHCPDVFVLLEDGISYVRDPHSRSIGNDPGGRNSVVAIPARLEQQVVDAALDCPGECIFVETEGATESAPVGISGTATGAARDHEDQRRHEQPGGIDVPRLDQSLDEPHVGSE
jgi:ferredoxin